MSGKWREGMISRTRINEYVRMLLGSYSQSNNVLSQATQTLCKMLNEQMEMDVRAGVQRAEQRRERALGLGPGQDGYVRPRRPFTDTEKALAGHGPDWKQRLAQAMFGRKMAEEDRDK